MAFLVKDDVILGLKVLATVSAGISAGGSSFIAYAAMPAARSLRSSCLLKVTKTLLPRCRVLPLSHTISALSATGVYFASGDKDEWGWLVGALAMGPREFITCDPPLDLAGNETARKHLGYGCTKYGGSKYEEVQKTRLSCHAFDEIECFGNRTFLADMQPCLKYSGHYFVTSLLYSVLLGFLGVDRFYLGHTGSAVGKLLTLGGLGVWWFVDVILLVLGQLKPEDGSNWTQHY
eukprot:gene5724-6424_t